MNKIFNLGLTLILALMLFSCAKEKKAEEKETIAKTYSIDAGKSSVQWTAYKTTDKLPVKGTFTEIKIQNSVEGSSAQGALNGLEFEIPVSSIFSNDTIRDAKLGIFFFDVMENTMSLKGVFSVEDEAQGKLQLTMNGMTRDLPFQYTMSQDTILVNATMDVNNWEAQNALESLHKACYEMHKGPDGVSKTWSEVGISAKILAIQK